MPRAVVDQRLRLIEQVSTSPDHALLLHLFFAVELHLTARGETSAAEAVGRAALELDDPRVSIPHELAALIPQAERMQSVSRSVRVREGIAYAKSQGKHCGRPLASGAPDGAAVRALRVQGRSWGQCAVELGSSVGAVRRAARRT